MRKPVTKIGADLFQERILDIRDEDGTVVRDLFDEEGGYLTDTSLLNRRVREKLQTVADSMTAEGWK
ncbi:hypothetical protein [Bradyrhizobium sp. USDA 4451]